MPATVEVRFKGNRKDYFLWSDGGEPLRLWDAVIVPADRGLDFGRVSATGDTATKKCNSCSGCAVGEVKVPELTVVRRATQEDVRTANELRRTEEATRRTVLERARERQLDMKVSDAEWQWDRRKLTVYFTAEKRVDFRELVRDLAATLHTRIELRQIGARDEAARLGGVGRCGKEYCCSSWLNELSPVSLALAKDQHLSLNPAQISGGCGRLLCCLKYEHEFYVSARKRFPKEGKQLRTSQGAERVIAVDIFRERVFLRGEEQGPRIITLAELKEELERLGEPPPEQRGGGAEGQRDRGTVGQRDGRTEGQRDSRTEGQRDRATEGQKEAEGSERRRRRRRRRGRRHGGEGGGPPATPPES
jgi:cell fate regulator YaaT (PSP1 superfamily)